MSAATITKRLNRIERARGFTGDFDRASDAQLWRIVRAGYPALRAEHSDLNAAVAHLAATGDTALATLIREDIEGGRA